MGRWWTRVHRAVGVCRAYRRPVTRFLDYLGWFPQGALSDVYLRNGMRIRARLGTSDLSIIDEVFVDGVYDRGLRSLRGGHTVIDIGAQCGIFALAAAARGAFVLCYEPVLQNLELLRVNASLNGYDSAIVPCNAAIAAQGGVLHLYGVDRDTGGSTSFPGIHPEWAQGRDVRVIEAPAVTLHEIFQHHRLVMCDLVKMDCEGAEYDVFQHAATEDLRRIRAIIMEYHPNGNIEVIAQRLRGLGFHVEMSNNPCVLFAAADEGRAVDCARH